jgi:quinol monooxygenase YgiN
MQKTHLNVRHTCHKGAKQMYGLIGKIIANEGKRDELIDILVNGATGMSGCLSYIVAKDESDPNSLWVTEVWESKEDHAASLSLPSVQEAITQGKPLIAGFGERFETTPIGGHGI